MAKKATSSSKKTATKKTAEKKPASKKTAVKKTIRKTGTVKVEAEKASGGAVTTVIAQCDVGWGNAVYLRGEGGGLSWEKGVPMEHTDEGWLWSTQSATAPITYKCLRNDEAWADGENLTVLVGGTSVCSPAFP
ncbi:MAG: hypothetical protein ACFB20_04470 [Opitutales bacterium]